MKEERGHATWEDVTRPSEEVNPPTSTSWRRNITSNKLHAKNHLKCCWMTSLKYSGVCCRWSSMAHLMVEGLQEE